MKTPKELAEVLQKYEDAQTAIIVYKEVQAIVKEYEVIEKAAIAILWASIYERN